MSRDKDKSYTRYREECAQALEELEEKTKPFLSEFQENLKCLKVEYNEALKDLKEKYEKSITEASIKWFKYERPYRKRYNEKTDAAWERHLRRVGYV